jgi:hypothetical protein
MRMSKASRRIGRFGRRLARDESGAVLIYVSIALAVFMGFAALVIDGSRLFTLDTELQSAADAIALAGAAELDGNADAQTRADAAMAALVQNEQTFGTGAAAITGFSRRFLDELPDDDQPITSDFEAADAPSTRFVEVTINEREIDSMFATAIGGDDTAGAEAVAVAGFTSAVCKFTPLFMCNPYEGTADTLAEFKEQISSTAERRKLIELKKHAGAGMYEPGNFGFLETGADDTKFRESLGQIEPEACFSQNGVETHTGNIASAHVPLNTRFDMYANGGEFSKNNADYPPAQNVTKGYLPEVKITPGKVTTDYCKPYLDETYATAMGFPIDSSFDANRIGIGDWDGKFETYWGINHPGVTPPTGWTNDDPPTRYDVYRWEIDEGEIPDNSSSTPTGENGNMADSGKRCSANAPVDDPDRRVLYAAIINCNANPFNGHTVGLPVVAFVKAFMTQPMSKEGCDPSTPPGLCDEDNTLYVEMIDVVDPGVDDEVVHDIVQLYR